MGWAGKGLGGGVAMRYELIITDQYMGSLYYYFYLNTCLEFSIIENFKFWYTYTLGSYKESKMNEPEFLVSIWIYFIEIEMNKSKLQD